MTNPATPNFVSKVTDYYTINSGVESDNPDLGKTYYRLNCGNGDGYGFYENGEYILNASKVSIERVGLESDKDIGDTNTFCPSKIILAEAGDIYFEALGGDIIMKGNNIYMQANGSEDDEGHILMTANNRFLASSKDVTINATDSVGINADNSCVVSGKILCNINGGLCSITDRHQFSFAAGVTNALITGDIFSPTKLLDIFKNFIVGKSTGG
tara:strand:+ start:647 stop:1285 length:639 start_codon:yes stop_codon:yes gene_type:complete